MNNKLINDKKNTFKKLIYLLQKKMEFTFPGSGSSNPD